MQRAVWCVILAAVLMLSAIAGSFLKSEVSIAGEAVTLDIVFGTLSFELPPSYQLVEWTSENISGRAEGLPIQAIFTRKDGSRETAYNAPESVGFWASSRSCDDNPDLRVLIQEHQPNLDWEGAIYHEGNINVPGDAGATYPGYYLLSIDEGDIHARIDGYLMALVEPGYAAVFNVSYYVEWVDYAVKEGAWTFIVDGQSPVSKHKADVAAMIASVRISWHSPESSSTPVLPTETNTLPEQTSPVIIKETSPLKEQTLIEISQVQGEVFIRKGDSAFWEEVSPAGGVILISAGSAVRTGKGSVCLKNIPGQGDKVFVGENTEVQIGEQVTKLDVLTGKLRALVKKLSPKSKFEVKTPLGVTTVRGTDFIVDSTPASTDVLMLEGVVEFSDLEGHKVVSVKTGESSTVTAGGLPSEPQKLDSATVFQKYKSLFESDKEINDILGNIEKPAKEGGTKGFPVYLLAIPVIIIAGVIILVMRRRRRA